MKLPSWLIKTAIISLWLPILLTLGWRFEKHEATPSSLGRFITAWPSGSGLLPDPNLPTVLMFIHPQCPCTRASLRQLDGIVSFHARQASFDVVVFAPHTVSRSWIESDTTSFAKHIPGVRVFEDRDGSECRRFGAKTSGTVLVFSPRGTSEVFRGGITPALGHEGDCAGGDTIDRYLETGQAPLRSAPVFGCFIY